MCEQIVEEAGDVAIFLDIVCIKGQCGWQGEIERCCLREMLEEIRICCSQNVRQKLQV